MIDLFAPSLAGDARLRQAWSRYERQAASPGSTVAIVRLIYESDVRPPLAGDPGRRRSSSIGRRRAGFASSTAGTSPSHIAGADARGAARRRQPDLGRRPGRHRRRDPGVPDRRASGARAAPRPRDRPVHRHRRVDRAWRPELGDARWQALLDEHHRTARRLLERFGGREVKTTGDGILATFDGPARAVRCATAMRDAVASSASRSVPGCTPARSRSQGDDIGGLAVHIGARISALASDGEVLVSGTVKDLVVGSGIAFEDRGTHDLKGVPGEWRLFAVIV